jgi:hypothetical protein
MMYTAEIASDGMIYLPRQMIGSGIRGILRVLSQQSERP